MTSGSSGGAGTSNRFTDSATATENAAEVMKFTGGKARPSKDFVKVFTPFGERIAKVSDYILKDSCGELSVCNPYEFTKNYEEFEDGIDVSVTRTRQFINEPKATVKRTIANKKVSAVIESQGGLTRLFVNDEEISKGYTVTADEGVSGEAVHDSGEVTEAHAVAAEAGKIPLEEMTIPLLKEHAAKNGIDLSGARNKPEIISAIYAAEAAKSETER